MSSCKTRRNLIAFGLLLSFSCSDQSTEPELRKLDLNLSQNESEVSVDFSKSPEITQSLGDSVEFTWTASEDSRLFATFRKDSDPKPSIKEILDEIKNGDSQFPIMQTGTIKSIPGRITFRGLVTGQSYVFYFFLKSDSRASALATVPVSVEKTLFATAVNGQVQKAREMIPWSMTFMAKCEHLELKESPKWMNIKNNVVFGMPRLDKNASGTVTFKLVGNEKKGCVGEKSFTLEILHDPLAHHSWHLENTGQKGFSWFPARTGIDINLARAHVSDLTGQGVHVRVADTGMQITHPDLVDNIVKELNVNIEARNPDGCAVCDPEDTTPFIEEGVVGDRGTAVAGIIAAAGWNGIGSRGIAPRATISAINIASLRMKPENVNWSDQLQGEFDVLQQSWSKSQLKAESYEPMSPGYEELLDVVAKQKRNKLGSIVVKAAGDEYLKLGSANLDPYNNSTSVLVVGSLDTTGKKSNRSNVGSSLWISAPGGEPGYQSDYDRLSVRGFNRSLFEPALISTDLFNFDSPCSIGYAKKTRFFMERFEEAKPVEHMTGDSSWFNLGGKPNSNCAYTATLHGTPAASAVVSGAVALLLEAKPDLTARDIRHILAWSAVKVDRNFTERYTSLGKQRVIETLSWTRNAGGLLYHNWYGFGALDISRALKFSEKHSPLPDLMDTGWIAVFGGGGTIEGQKPRGLESTYQSKTDKTVETVRVKLNVSITRMSKLGVELRSPSGTRSILLPLNNGSKAGNPKDLVLSSNAFYGEEMKGTWSLQLLSNIDEEEGIASLDSWFIQFTGH